MKENSKRKNSKNISISQDVASNALPVEDDISKEVLQAVLQSSQRLGHRFNRTVRCFDEKPISIGIILPNAWPEFYGLLSKGLQNELVRNRDYKLSAQFRSISNLYSDNEIENALESLIEERVDAVILCPAFVTNYSPYLDKLCENNIPTILLGADLANGKRLASVRVDAYMSGRLAGEFLGGIVPDNKSVAVFIGNKDIMDYSQKVDGFLHELKYSTCKVCGIYETHGEPEVAYHLTKMIIKERHDLGGIFVATGNLATVCECVLEHGLEGKIKIIGTDVFPDIKRFMDKGVMSGIIYQDPVKQGEIAINTLYSYLVDGCECNQSIFIKPSLILKSNLSGYL